MSRTCLLVHELTAPAESSASTLVHSTWALARTLTGLGEKVTLLETAPANEGQRKSVREAAAALGAEFVHLDEFPSAYDQPLLPAVPAHRLAFNVAAAIGRMDPENLWVIGEASRAATLTGARQSGLRSGPKRLIVVLDGTGEFRRERAATFPTAGRADIAKDYLERLSVAGADALICRDEGLKEWLVGETWSLPLLVEVWPDARENAAAVGSLLGKVNGKAADVTPLPRVSVCIPYYEQPQFLASALEMIEAQTQPPFEVIVVDDGSKSSAARQAFDDAERRFLGKGWRFFKQDNAGPAAARNRAAKEATGDALLFCDADNRFRPEMIAVFSRALSSSGSDCVSCAFEAFAEESNSADSGPESGTVKPKGKGYVFAPLGACLELGLIENTFGDTNFIVRRGVFESLGGFPVENREASEDWQFLLRLVAGGGRLSTVPAVLFDYRLASESHARRHSEFASARAAVGSFVAKLDPAWRRLWPHLAGIIRNPRLPLAEAELEVALAERDFARIGRDRAEDTLASTLESHAAETAEWRRRDRMRRSNAILLESSIQALSSQVAATTAEASEQRRKDAAEIARLSREVAGLTATLAARNDKIGRMQESFSWRSTAPLRAARRKILDQTRAARGPADAKGAQANSAGATAGASKDNPWHFRHHLDAPRSWNRHHPEVIIRGWCFCEETGLLQGIRARIGGRTYPGTYGLDRPDLLRAFEAFPQCARSGFKIEALVLPSDRSVSLEVSEGQDEWRSFLELSLDPADVADAPGSYEHWVRHHDSPTEAELASLRAKAAALESPRLISVLMPVFNPEEKWLARAIESVRSQVYPHWELCIADDASTKPYVRPLLEAASAADSRIKVVFRAKNGHISAASNSALELARGDFAALFDHDDELAPHALYCVAREIAEHPGVELVYTDEDKIDEQGFRFDPHFKPDWNPDLLNGQNYISHLAVYRTQTLRNAGGLREGFEGSQDWDLALRVTERIAPKAIRHIPRVLYHWRASEGSTSLHLGEKNYVEDASRRALGEHFTRLEIDAKLQTTVGGHWQVTYPVPKPAPLVSILIPTHNAERLVRICTASIFARTSYKPYEIVIVDNRSDDPASLALFKELAGEDGVRILRYDAPFNYSAINNFAARQAHGDVLCLLNNDIEVLGTGWLDELASHALRPGIGAVGARLYYPDMSLQHAGVITGLGGVAGHAFKNFSRQDPGTPQFRPHLAQDLSVVTAACLAIRRDVYFEAGGFDEEALTVAFNDVDFCLKVEALGYRNLYTPFAELIHHESASRGQENTPDKVRRFQGEIEAIQGRWGARLLQDPAYNPNLSLDTEDFALAYPPRTPSLL